MAHLSSSSSFSHILLNRSIIRNWKNELFFSFPVYLNWWVCPCFCLCSFYVFIRVESISGFSLCGRKKKDPLILRKKKKKNTKNHTWAAFPSHTVLNIRPHFYFRNMWETDRPRDAQFPPSSSSSFPPPAPIFTPGKTRRMMKKKTFAWYLPPIFSRKKKISLNILTGGTRGELFKCGGWGGEKGYSQVPSSYYLPQKRRRRRRPS